MGFPRYEPAEGAGLERPLAYGSDDMGGLPKPPEPTGDLAVCGRDGIRSAEYVAGLAEYPPWPPKLDPPVFVRVSCGSGGPPKLLCDADVPVREGGP